MISAAVLLLSVVSGQAPVTQPEVNERAAAAAERAAVAAEKAAEAAQRAAESAARSLEAQGAPKVLAPAAAVAAAPAAAPAGWTASIGAGLISLTGNSQSLTFTLNGAAEKKTEYWVYSAKANAAYGQTRPAASTLPAEVVALAAGAQLRTDYRATETVTAYLKAGADTDHVKSLEARIFGEAGSGITWIERKEAELLKLQLRTDLALRFSHESRYQYFPTAAEVPDATLVAPRVGLAFRYALSKVIVFTEDAEVLPNVLGDGRVLFNSTSKLATRMTASLSVGVSFVVNHDSVPAPGKLPTDTALTVGLELTL